eukprot:1415719-Lingulodinium_polyedra.AAC.1
MDGRFDDIVSHGLANAAQRCDRINRSSLQRIANRTLAHSMRAPTHWRARVERAGARFASRCGKDGSVRPHRCATFHERCTMM